MEPAFARIFTLELSVTTVAEIDTESTALIAPTARTADAATLVVVETGFVCVLLTLRALSATNAPLDSVAPRALNAPSATSRVAAAAKVLKTTESVRAGRPVSLDPSATLAQQDTTACDANPAPTVVPRAHASMDTLAAVSARARLDLPDRVVTDAPLVALEKTAQSAPRASMVQSAMRASLELACAFVRLASPDHAASCACRDSMVPTAFPCPLCDAIGGTCSDSITGTGKCICKKGFKASLCDECGAGRFGSQCIQCPICGNGDCDTGRDGTGTCECRDGFTATYCNQCDVGRFGYQCDSCPACVNGGKCDEGIRGTGTCKCPVNYAGDLCEKCAKGYFGPDCRQCVQCDMDGGVCEDGLTGNGTCACNAGFQHTNGTSLKICDDCDGNSTRYGKLCTPCQSCGLHGTCRAGRAANGTCACDEGWMGPLCDQCALGFYGSSCMSCPRCQNGTCVGGVQGDGRCKCFTGYTGDLCERVCDQQCLNAQSSSPAKSSGGVSVGLIVGCVVGAIGIACVIAGAVIYRKRNAHYSWLGGKGASMGIRDFKKSFIVQKDGAGFGNVRSAVGETKVVGDKVFINESDLDKMPRALQELIYGNAEAGGIFENPLFEPDSSES
eukprot:Opistho-2@31054